MFGMWDVRDVGCQGCGVFGMWDVRDVGYGMLIYKMSALINITENTRKALDDGNMDCGVFVDLQKAFDTVDRQILLTKLNSYGIRGVSNDWFKSCLSNRSQYVSINEYESGLAAINFGVSQGSALRPLLFLLYINDLNQAIKFCKVHHFAGD